jgi:hypothetical protein
MSGNEADAGEKEPMIGAVVEWFMEDATHKDSAGGHGRGLTPSFATTVMKAVLELG